MYDISSIEGNMYSKDVIYNRLLHQQQQQQTPQHENDPQVLPPHQQTLTSLYLRDRLSSTSPLYSRVPTTPTRSSPNQQLRSTTQPVQNFISNSNAETERTQYNPYVSTKSLYPENNNWQHQHPPPQPWYHPATTTHSMPWHQNQVTPGPQNIDPGTLQLIFKTYSIIICLNNQL